MKVYYISLVMWLVSSAVALPNQSFRISTKGNNPLHHRAIREVEEMAPDFEIIDLSLPDWDDSTQNCIDCEDKEILSKLNQKQIQRLSLRDAPVWNHEQSGSGDGDSEDYDANEDLDSVTETAIERPKVYKEINRLLTTRPQLDEIGMIEVDSTEVITNLIKNVPQTTEASENPDFLGNSKQTEAINFSRKSRLFPESPILGLDHTVAANKHREFDEDYEVQETDVDYAKIEYSSLTKESEDSPTMHMLSTNTGLLTTESEPKTSSAEEDSPIANSPGYCTVPKEMVFVMLSANSLTKEQGTNATMECQVILKDVQLVLPDAMIEWTFTPANGAKCSLGPNSHIYQACDNRDTSITAYNNTSASLLDIYWLTPNHTGFYTCCVSWECNPGVTMLGSQMRVKAEIAILLKVYDKPEYYYQIGVMSGFCGLLILLLAAFCYIKLKNSSQSQVLYNVQSIESPTDNIQATDSKEEQVTKAPLVKKDSQFSKLSFVSDDEEEDAKDDV